MHYTLMIASHDYGCLGLDKRGNEYVAYAYISGYGTTHEERFDNYDMAEKRFLAMCENSHVTPIKVEHDIEEFMALTAD